MTAWKRTDRRIAAELAGVCVPVTGRAHGDAPDVAQDWLSPKVKHWASLPAWFTEALEQARASSRDGRIPLAVLHASGKRYANAGCLVALRDLRMLLGPQSVSEREAGNDADCNTTPDVSIDADARTKKGRGR